jgi:methanogenic corrinoid protein MtbC1
VAVLACLPGEQHDLGLIAFGLALRSRGWRIVYLGADAPIGTVADAAGRLRPDLVVLYAATEHRVGPIAGELGALAARHRVALGGAAARSEGAASAAVLALAGDVVAEADAVTARVRDAAAS